MRASRNRVAGVLLAAFVLALASAGCGSDGDDGAAMPPPPADPEDFPRAEGKSLAQLRAEVRGEDGPVLSPSVSQLAPGRNRFGFGLFDRARAQIADAPVAVYTAPVGGGEASGPFLAGYESLAVEPQFQSQSVSGDPDAARSLYVADLRFPRDGEYEVIGIARLDDRLVAATPAGGPVTVTSQGRVPDIGDRAPRISTPTEADVAGDLAQIDTREPFSTMHDKDFADVVGKQPVVLVFATPALCQSRVCGPVVDVAEQVKAERGDEAEFIHMEIFRENEIGKGFRQQVVEWSLPTEPWVFAVDRRGRVAGRLEGAYSAEELDRIVDAAVKG